MSFFFSLKEYKKIIRQLLLPKEHHLHIEEVNLEELYHLGYTSIVLDVDNTVMSYSQKKIGLQKLNWIEKTKALGFKIFLISNNSSKRRIEAVCRQLRVNGIYFALKPFPFGVKEVLKDNYLASDKCIFIGDQIFKDVLLGNWLKGYTILVNPIDTETSMIKTIQWELEKYILKKANRLSPYIESKE